MRPKRDTSPSLRLRRVLRYAGLLVTVALLVWFTHYAYLRLTVMPPLSLGEYAGLSEAGLSFQWRDADSPPSPDLTPQMAQIAQTLSSIEGTPYVLPAPPAGMRWEGSAEIRVTEVLHGAWTPATRPHLQATIGHLESPPVRNALIELRDLRKRDLPLDMTNGLTYEAARAIIDVLLASARYRSRQLGDVRGGWEDIDTALWVTQTAPCGDLWDVGSWADLTRSCVGRIQDFLRECDLDAGLAADVQRSLQSVTRAAHTWQSVVRIMEKDGQARLDCFFTRDSDGEGWRVLSVDDHPRGGNRSRLWNLASVFYNDRRTVERKLAARFAALRSFPAAGLVDGVMALDSAPRLTALDRPFGYGDFAYAARAYVALLDTEAYRRAVCIMVAMNRYRAEHGSYPADLEALVPKYIARLPREPFAGAHFHYQRKPDGFDLWLERKWSGPVAGRVGKIVHDIFLYAPRIDFARPCRSTLFGEPWLVPISGHADKR
jgi:hypothetical protein